MGRESAAKKVVQGVVIKGPCCARERLMLLSSCPQTPIGVRNWKRKRGKGSSKKKRRQETNRWPTLRGRIRASLASIKWAGKV